MRCVHRQRCANAFSGDGAGDVLGCWCAFGVGICMLHGAVLSLHGADISPSCARTSLCSQCKFSSRCRQSRCLACASGLPDAFDLDYDALDEFLRRIEAMMCVTLALSLIPHRQSRSAHSHRPSYTSHTTRRAASHRATCSCCKHIASLHMLAPSAYLARSQTDVYVNSALRCKRLPSHDTHVLTR